MKNILETIRTNVLIKIASINSVAIVVRIIAGFLTSKVIAIYVGAEGMALIGNLRNFLSTAQSFSTLGFSNGIIKYVSELKERGIELSKTISSSFYAVILASLIVSLYCYLDAENLNNIFFTPQNDYVYVIQVLAISLPFYSVNAFVLAVINGLSKFKQVIYINISAQILGLAITLSLIWLYQLQGALISVVTVQSLIFLITVLGVYKEKHYLKFIKLNYMSLTSLKNLGSYSIMALFTSLTLPLITVAIRKYIITTNSLFDAGLWEAMNRISEYYLMFISTLLTLYLLPRFSKIKTKRAFRKEVFSFYKFIIPIFSLGLIIIYLLRGFIIRLVFTYEFAAVEELFFWQLLGDFLKVLSIVIAYQFLAKKMLWYYLITEAMSMLVLYASSLYFIDLYGVKGATMAHFLNYLFYLILIILIFWKSLFGKLPFDEFVKD